MHAWPEAPRGVELEGPPPFGPGPTPAIPPLVQYSRRVAYTSESPKAILAA